MDENQGDISYETGKMYNELSISIHDENNPNNYMKFQTVIDSTYPFGANKFLFDDHGDIIVAGFLNTDNPNERDVFITKINLKNAYRLLPVNDRISQQQLSVFPNPTQGGVYLQTELSVNKIQVLDMHGHLLFEDASPQAQLDLGNLSSGIYLLKAFTIDSGIVYSTVIKK